MRRRDVFLALLAALAPTAALANEPRRRGGGETFVQIVPLVVNVPRPGGRRGVLTVDLGLEIADPALRIRAESLTPRIRAELFAFTQTYGAGLRPGGLPDPDQLSRAYQAVVDRQLGARGARVLMGAVLVN